MKPRQIFFSNPCKDFNRIKEARFTYFCTKKKEPKMKMTMYLCREQYRKRGEVKLKPAYSLPPSERMTTKVKMSEAVPHLQR